MTEERKTLEMLQAGQITIDEALGLLEALRDAPTQDEEGFSRDLRREVGSSKVQPEPSVKLFKVDIDQSGEEDKNLNFQVPVESAVMMESFIPSGIKKIIASQGFELGALLVSLNKNFPDGRILDMHVSDDDCDTNIVLEVTS